MKKVLLVMFVAIIAVGAVFAADGKYTVKASCEVPMFFYYDYTSFPENLIYQAGVDYNFDNGVSVGVGAAVFPYDYGEEKGFSSITADVQYKYSFGKFSLAANAEFLSFILNSREEFAEDYTIKVSETENFSIPLKLLVASKAGFMAYSLNPSYKINDKFEVWGKLTYVPIFNFLGDEKADGFLKCCSFGLGIAYNL